MTTDRFGRRLDHLPVGGELLLLGRDGRVGQEQVLGAVQADAAGPDARGRGRVDHRVDVGQQLDPLAVGGDRLQVAVLDQRVAQVDVLALQLAVGGLDLRAGVEDDVPLAAVHDQQVAVVDLRRATRSGPRRPGCPARGPGWRRGRCVPPASVTIPATGSLSNIAACDGRISGATRMTGSLAPRACRSFSSGQLGDDLLDHVADVGHPLAQVLVADAGEQDVVLFQRLVQGGGGVELVVEDERLDLGDEGRVAEEHPVGAEDGGRVLADLAADAVDGLVQFGGDGVAGLVEPGDFGGQGGGVEQVRAVPGQGRVEPERPGDGHAGRDGHAAEHEASVAGAGHSR